MILGLELWEQFFSSHDGVLGTPAVEELLGVRHAVALVAFDDEPEQLLLRNSWGARWGAEGHATLPYSAVAVVCVGAWVVEDNLDS